MATDAGTRERHSKAEEQTREDQNPADRTNVSIGWEELCRCIRKKLTEENGVTNASSRDRCQNREERGCVLIFDGITEDAEETEASSFKDQTECGSNKE